MIVTHEEAKTKFCPHIRLVIVLDYDKKVVDVGNPDLSKGIVITPTHNVLQTSQGSTMTVCKTTDCMAWVPAGENEGFCKIGGKEVD